MSIKGKGVELTGRDKLAVLLKRAQKDGMQDFHLSLEGGGGWVRLKSADGTPADIRHVMQGIPDHLVEDLNKILDPAWLLQHSRPLSFDDMSFKDKASDVIEGEYMEVEPEVPMLKTFWDVQQEEEQKPDALEGECEEVPPERSTIARFP